MRLQDAHEKLDILEQSCSIELLRLGEFNAWPMVRLILWNSLVSPEPSVKSRKLAAVRDLPTSMILNVGLDRILTKLPNWIKSTTYSWASESDVLLIGRPSHTQYVAGYRAPFDRVLDPIRFAIGSRLRATSVFLGAATPRKIGRRRLRLVVRGRTCPVAGLLESGLLEQLERLHIDKEAVISELEAASRDFWLGYHSFCKLMEQARALQAMFVSVWYSAEMMGLIAAARQNHVTVVDVQHGADESNAMGSWKMKICPRSGYQMAPQIFWRWHQSESYSPELVKNEEQLGHRSVVGGYPWISYWQLLRTQISESSANSRPLRSSRYQVLFSVRNPFGESRERIPDFLLEFLQMPHPDVSVVIRLHPNDYLGRRNVQMRLSGILHTHFRIVNPGEDLYQSLSESTHLVTAFSAVCLEALTLGVPTLLFGDDAKLNYKELIESNRVMWTAGSAEDLERFIYSDAELVASPVIDSSSTLTTKTVSDILKFTKSRAD